MRGPGDEVGYSDSRRRSLLRKNNRSEGGTVRDFLFGTILVVFLFDAVWFIVSVYPTRAALRREAMPLEVRFLQGEKLSADEARRLVEIHNEIEGLR